MRRIAILLLILVVIVVAVLVEFSREEARVGTSLSEADPAALEQNQPATHRSKDRGLGGARKEEPRPSGEAEVGRKAKKDRTPLANRPSPVHSLTGKILDPWGQACAGARLSGILEGETVSLFEALADAQGQFSTALEPFTGRLFLKASAGFAAAMKSETAVTASELGKPLTIQLKVERFIQLRVLNMDRSPLVDARVQIYSEEETQPLLVGTTNQQGEYKIIGLKDGRYRCDTCLAVSKTMNLVVVDARPFDVPSDEFIEVVLNDSLKPTAFLEGTFSEELVRVVRDGGIPAGMIVSFVDSRAQCEAALILDENGHFKAGPFPSGSATGEIAIPGYLVTVPEFRLRAESSTDIGIVNLPQDMPLILVVAGNDCDGSLFTLSQAGTLRESTQKNAGEDEVRFSAVTAGAKIVIECRDQTDTLRSKSLMVPAVASEFRVVMDW